MSNTYDASRSSLSELIVALRQYVLIFFGFNTFKFTECIFFSGLSS